ncbi:long-chain-fatty-acid--CoA ligase [Caulobacter sp. UNC279MFTsu5.1]|uniref:long-chain-fatty-acid--CoA ligase n=1 Tax=Caulobacter sp. UNC279MFTsu5.1 TaxID=1502775 RepID=UPI0008E5F05D|nr:long-chain-fatty-acid--CoA ligase [Caulobacter sp. UNC279MFTsu5.1]SFJ04717.1 fatty-acyl-CoA synthase [Caulobacter sp. UNC279MFTsu5.1]
MQGLMQHGALTVDKIIDHAAQWHGAREVVTRSVEGPIVRTTYGAIHDRAKRVSNALLALGIKPGDRVGTLAWNTGRHMEAWYGIMGIGAVCHTLNPRLFPEQIAWIANHAGDRAIFVDLTFMPIIAGVLQHLPTVEHVVLFTDRDHMPADFRPAGETPNFKGLLCFEDLVEQHRADCAWGGFDEGTAAGLCYTSGTTGDPKGVLYSHRSNVLHTLITLQPDVMGLSQKDVILPVVPMFHANAWGVAFSAPGTGAKMVMPGAKMDGASIFELLDSEGVTFSAAVPTVWQMLLQHLKETGARLPALRKVVIGGAACPEHIIRAFHDDYDVEVVHAWGMTETSPVGTLSVMTDELEKLPYDQQMPYRLKQGRPPLGVELKLTDDAGRRLPHDGKSFGNLKIRGPIIAAEYFRGAGGRILDDEGFFDTGDVATIDDHGFMQITDRAKDVVKSGGEWISTIDIENIALGHPKAAMTAVIGVPHPKWDERPILLVKLKDGETATKAEFLDFLQGKIAKWWTPDDVVFVDEIPLGATGKIDKKLIRQRMADYVLPALAVAGVAEAEAAADPDPEPEPPAGALAAADGTQAARLYAPEPEEPLGEPPPLAEPPVVEALAHADAEPEPEPQPDPPAAFAPEAEPVFEARGQQEHFPLDPLNPAPPLGPVPEEAFHAKPVFVAEEPPLAMPVIPPSTGRKARAKAGKSGGPTAGLLDLALLIALTPALLVAAGALGVKFGVLPPAVGYDQMTLDWAPKAAVLGVATGVLGLIAALFGGVSRFWKKALAALAITVAALGVMVAANVLGGRTPPIHDVATDWKTPLMLSDAGLAARGGDAQTVEADPSLPVGSLAFAGRRVADINAETCPAARPLVLQRSPADAYEAAKAAVQAAGLTIVTDDPMDGRLEAVGQSFWYGLKDDLIVRVRPDTAGARVDIRSVGRAPGPDMGRNCRRVGRLLAAVKG